ncbi:conserved hypothetical protein [Hyphomicrobiales bacterium]|nr:conserved hypothetical protein [Hyphomicrobiales bacterium]CAH1667864.1 conserved hypothetical protein [Hyphomicrobiales bacterium]
MNRPSPTMLQTYSGRYVDLLAPDITTLNFEDAAIHLAATSRFNGATRFDGAACLYSVAQHTIIGTEEFQRQGKIEEARAFLLHDVQEYLIGDDTRPKRMALISAIAREIAPDNPDIYRAVRRAEAAFRRRIDAAIHVLAGVPWPLTPPVALAVDAMDCRLLRTEKRDLMIDVGPWGDDVEEALPLDQRIVPWPSPIARARLAQLFRRLLPALADPT